MTKILSIFGTRPEAIKMAPIISKLNQVNNLESIVCVTGQHRHMLDQMLELFSIQADYDLDLMEPNQTLSTISQKSIERLEPVLKQAKPDCVLVQGDTTTAMIAALTAFYHKIPVAHVEAGLRTFNPNSPFPEEINRKLVASLASWHFAPTQQARKNLLDEGVDPSSVFLVGNTVIDSLLGVVNRFEQDFALTESMQNRFSAIDFNKRIILVTGHRRENWGEGIENLCEALKELAQYKHVEVVYPVHLNPNVKSVVMAALSNVANIHLVEPLDYLPFVYLLSRCYMVITDSGGVQEEAPSLGKPVLVTRDTTERPEGITAGTAKLVGRSKEGLLKEAALLLNDTVEYQSMASACNPYGDGSAAQQIVNTLVNKLQVTNQESLQTESVV